MRSNFLPIIPGTLVYYEKDIWEIRLVYDTTFIAGLNTRTSEVKRLRISELKELPEEQEPSHENTGIPSLSATIEESAWTKALDKYNIIRPLLELGTRRSDNDVSIAALQAGVSRNTIYRWIRLFSKTGQISSLARHKRSDTGDPRLQPEVEALLTETIKEEFLTNQKKRISSVCTTFRARCIKAGLVPPHNNTVRNRIFSLQNDLKLSKRYGSKYAKEKLSPILGSFPGADYPLSIVQIDHTPIDIIVVDEYTRRPLGRPWLTLAIDVFSRMICGFYISLNTPGTIGTAICISQSILPKDHWLAKRNITNDWPIWGCPHCIHLDNAKEFRGNSLKRACEEYGIRLEWRPVATPHWGGHVERFAGTLLRKIHELPGSTFSNPQERGRYDSMGQAALTLYELEQWLGEYITGVYHKSFHSEISMSPEKKWEIGILGNDEHPGVGLPARPLHVDRLLLDFLPIRAKRQINDRDKQVYPETFPQTSTKSNTQFIIEAFDDIVVEVDL